MTIEEMKIRKKELGYSNETIAQLSGVPFSTVQKVFSGKTSSPRQKTILALEKVLKPSSGVRYPQAEQKADVLHETALAYLHKKQGEYTLELARRNPQNIYIGVDIKGARLWRGAKTATQEALPNVAFLRTRIEFINAFFAPGEVSQIWLTFSDPQMKSENSRLTSPVFLERYRKFLRPGGIVHLKTDSRFLHEYTKAVVAVNGFRLLACTDNLYGDAALGRDFQGSSASPHPTTGFAGGPPASGPRAARPLEIPALGGIPAEVREVQTYYESMFLQQGLPISYMAFTIDVDGPIAYPRDPEDFDSKAMRAAEKAR